MSVHWSVEREDARECACVIDRSGGALAIDPAGRSLQLTTTVSWRRSNTNAAAHDDDEHHV
jgi:hypothetical protein